MLYLTLQTPPTSSRDPFEKLGDGTNFSASLGLTCGRKREMLKWELSPFLPLHSGSQGTRQEPVLSLIDKANGHSGWEVLSQVHSRSPRVASALC